MLCSFNLAFQLINSISRDLPKLLKYFNGAAAVASSKIPFAAAVLPINLVVYLKDLKALVLIIEFPKSSPSSSE